MNVVRVLMICKKTLNGPVSRSLIRKCIDAHDPKSCSSEVSVRPRPSVIYYLRRKVRMLVIYKRFERSYLDRGAFFCCLKSREFMNSVLYLLLIKLVRRVKPQNDAMYFYLFLHGHSRCMST